MSQKGLSLTEQNYIKVIYELSVNNNSNILTSDIANAVNIRSASATDMLGKLADKKLVEYEKYYGARLTEKGKSAALNIVRKHRLWEVFLTEKLGFGWDEVHEMAEELEHATSDELSDRLENFLGHPKTDPHGEPIPNKKGELDKLKLFSLSTIRPNMEVELKRISDETPSFLQYLQKNNLVPGVNLIIHNLNDFDESMDIVINGKNSLHISNQAASHLWVAKIR
ncbi:MAG TPA: metal-dependent transcriptional regulator [Bacteroidia bacterium]|nr:metal-dependent transcriptional regulator [Bacteroidia bacterium]OQB64672.1 MAG: Iron-dependent repressor IdeR [Bacteroidetes bacterium ADurb.Bin141]HNR47637.1 metal-dependent transcriptional regulator [Bacteroidia bacterium]HNT81530.1 metal-dependent transcriptional regulator [Bacteroidia bacterium]